MGGGGSGIGVEISTIDGFQGREKDVIIFSCVRSSSSRQVQVASFLTLSSCLIYDGVSDI